MTRLDDDQRRLLAEVEQGLRAASPQNLEAALGEVPRQHLQELLRHVGATVHPDHIRGGPAAYLQRLVDEVPTEELLHFGELLGRGAWILLGGEPDAALGAADALARRIAESCLAGEIAEATELDPGLVRLVAAWAGLRAERNAKAIIGLFDEGGLPPLPSLFAHHRGQGDIVRSWMTLPPHGLAPQHALVEARGDPADAAGGATTAAAPVEAVFEDPGTFSELDRVLLRTAEATYSGELGAPSRSDFRQLVDEFVRLSTPRPSSYFLLGFATALDDEITRPTGTAMDRARWRWYRCGRMAGLIRGGDEPRLREEVTAYRDETADLIADRSAGGLIVAGVVRALLPEHAPVAASLLAARRHPFPGALELYRNVYGRARLLVISERPSEAEALFDALEHMPLPDPDRTTATQRRSDLLRRKVNCRRSLGDFASAERLLAQVPIEELDERGQAAIHAERGLAAATIGHLSHVAVPDESSRENLVVRLRAGAKHFEEALEHNPDDVRACYCLGVLAICDGDHARASALLERAEAGLVLDPVLSRTGLPSRARFHRAASTLLRLEPGTDAATVDAMTDALAAGYVPPTDTIVEVGQALMAMRSAHAGTFVSRAAEAVGLTPEFADLVLELGREGYAEAARLASDLADDTRFSFGERFAFLESAVETATQQNHREWLEDLVERLEHLVLIACSPPLDVRWAQILQNNDRVREVLGPAECDMQRIQALQRAGDLDEALAIAETLFYRAAQGGHEAVDPHDLLDVAAAVGASATDLERMRAALPAEPAAEEGAAELTEPAHVVFVGGEGTQAQHFEEIEARVGERYGDMVTITWFPGGWTHNWGKEAERIEIELDRADALVLMTYMRTKLGRRLRKSAGQRGVIWRSCTGQGKDSMERTIMNAIEALRGSRAD